jgi:phage gp29-like protein
MSAKKRKQKDVLKQAIKARTVSPLRFNNHYEPASVAQTIDAARLGDILRSAEAGNMQDYFSLARDVVAGHGHTLAEFSKRKLAVLAPAHVIAAADQKSADEVAVAKAVAEQLDEVPGFLRSCLHLLDSCLYPVALVEKIWRPSSRPGWRYELEDLRVVPHRLLNFSTGNLTIWDCNEDGCILGTWHAVDPIRYIVHRAHILTGVPDTWGGPMRAVLFWWLFSVQGRDWWARFLERFGSPFMVGRYDDSDLESRFLLEQAFSAATRLFGLAVPNDTSVELQATNTSQGGDAFEKFHSVANREISKIVLGQTLSAEGQSLGLGGGQASAQADVRDNIRQFDAVQLSSTLRTQLLGSYCRLNGWTTPPPKISWGSDDSAGLEITGNILSSLADAGLRLKDEGIEALSKQLALPLERMPATETPLRPTGFSVRPTLRRPLAGRSQALRQATDKIAEKHAPELSAAFAKTLSPILDLVSSSTSLSDLSARLAEVFPTISHRHVAALAHLALTPSALNACLSFPVATR